MFIPALILLIVLAAGLGFVTLRRIEVARGARFYDAFRSELDVHATELWQAAVLGGVPLHWRQSLVVKLHDLVHRSVQLLVIVLRALEAPLARLSYKMRVSAPKAPSSTQVSDFLKTITPDKQGGDLREKSV